MEYHDQRISLDPTTPIYLRFADIELAEFLGYHLLHPQSMQALTSVAIATTCSLYASYSLVWQFSPRKLLSQVLRILCDTGQLTLYTLFPNVDEFRESRIDFY